MMETRCGGLLFTSKFDSGNLAHVEKTERSDSDSDAGGNVMYGCTITPDYEFNIWTKPDCAGTPYENGNRSWFYFGIRGYSPNKLIKLNIVNLNRQGKLYSQGMSPLVKVVPSKPRWERIRDRPSHQVVDGQFILSFTHRLSENRGGTTYFAFCYPWTYTECQEAMEILDEKHKNCCNLKPNEEKDDTIYYHRELLCHSIDQRRVDLITITSCENMGWQREPRLEKLFPDKTTPRCHRFHNKRVYFLSSRVHPGETPASFVFNGFLKFILRETDPRAQALRKRYIFKLIPMLNPDGVYRGHYRTDQKGVNLNRVYLNPDPELHSSIFGSRSLILFYHHYYKSMNIGEMRKDVDLQSSSPASNDGWGTPQEKNGSEFTDNENDLIENFGKVNLKVKGTRKDMNRINTTKNLHVRETSYIPYQGDYLSIRARESGIAFYVDLHGHASKRGCFIYGNHMEVEEDQVDNLLFPKLISLNSAHFDFNGCNFTERNMYLKDKRDGMSKEGSGRVAMFKVLGLIHSYTLECNYNTGRTVNSIPQAAHDNGRATPPPPAGFPPKYTPDSFEEVGRALAVSGLDMIQSNPWSRILHSEFTTYENLRNWMIRYVRSSRGNPILPRKMARVSTRAPTNNNTNNNNGSGAIPRNSRIFTNEVLKTTSNNLPSANPRYSSSVRNVYNNPQIPTNNKLAPVKAASSSALNSRRPVVQNNQSQNDAMKRQRNLIRAAVNGNTKTATSSVATSGLSISEMQGFHLHEHPTSVSKDVHVTLSFTTTSGGHGVVSSRPFLTSTTQSNPEISVRPPASAGSNFTTSCNSDGELFDGNTVSRRLNAGIPDFIVDNSDKRARGSHLRGSPLLESLYGTGEIIDRPPSGDKLPSAVKSLYLGNRGSARNRSVIWSSSSKQPSKLPVRSRTKDFITPQVSKPPSILYRGRSPGQAMYSHDSVGVNAHPSVVGTSPVAGQIVVGPGGIITMPSSHGNQRGYNAPLQMNDRVPMSSSVYMMSNASMAVQPLVVSQKPLLQPAQKEEYPPEEITLSNYQNSPILERIVSNSNFTLFNSNQQRKDPGNSSAGSLKNNGRKSAKGKFGKKKQATKFNQINNESRSGSRTPVGKETLGKKKFKSRFVKRSQSLKQPEYNQNELSGEAIKLSPRISKSPDFLNNESGDVPLFTTKLNQDVLENKFNNLETEIEVAAKGSSPLHHSVLDSDYLFETADNLRSSIEIVKMTPDM